MTIRKSGGMGYNQVATNEFLDGGGECGALIRAKDWSQTSLGVPEQWPQSLKTAVRIVLTSRQPMFVWWGKQLINIYNDAYQEIVGGKHPEALGQPAKEVWREIWDQVGPRVETAISDNVGTYDEALLLIMQRHGYSEETYYTFSYSPIPGDSGNPEGIICANTDDTQRIIGERQLTLLKDIAARCSNARSAAEACRLGARSLQASQHDIPFALVYLSDSQDNLQLEGVAGIDVNHPAVVKTIAPGDSDPWRINRLMTTKRPQYINDIYKKIKGLPSGAWGHPPHSVAIVPIGRDSRTGQVGRTGALVVGLNPYRLYDGSYKDFIKLVAGEISASITNAEAYQQERRRAEALAELDRAKTSFFSNVSHEFRTPLTLMLGPLEELLLRPVKPTPSPQTKEQLAVVYRNGLRLQKLVNTLLDFSRIEAGRAQAMYLPTDLHSLTVDLASNFRSAIEKAGMQFVIASRPLSEPIYVDKEMWEKIVLNLLSNAFKYTLSGTISVNLREQPASVELTVADTGIGIRKQELPRLFERFHRVQGVQARTHEGTGIGLALVYELVKLLGGTIKVKSTYGIGTTFAVRLPKGYRHLPAGQVVHQADPSPGGALQDFYLQEANRWQLAEVLDTDSLPDADVLPLTQSNKPDTPVIKARIVLADDNADMRQYVARLLSRYYDVTAVADGVAALKAIKKTHPDLVVTDVMMQRLDGFGLLKKIRQNPDTELLPVIMLSARAGEEARVEGLDAGADDYLVKPFGARELLARVNARLELARLREQAAQQVSRERKRLYDLFMHAPACIAVMSGPDLVFELANEPYRQLVGTDRAIDGLPLLKVLPDISPSLLKTIRRVATKGERFVSNELPATLAWREGMPAFTKYFNLVYEPSFDEHNTPNGLMVFAHDISEQVSARQKVAESEARLRFMSESMPQMIFTITPNGQVSYANPQWERYTGLSVPEFMTDTTARRKLVHPEDVASAEDAWQHYFMAGKPLEYEYRLRRKDGVYRWFICRVNPMKNKAGKVVLWVGSNTDIDDMRLATNRRHELEMKTATLTEQRSQLLALNQAKDEFISLASHQLRTPATGVKQYLGMLLQGYAGDVTSDQKAFLQTAYESNERQITIVNDLLQVARIDAGKVTLHKTSTDLVRLIKNVLNEQASKFAERNQKVVFNPKHTSLKARIDADRIRMVIDNLTDNACKYTQPDKTVAITVRPISGHIELAIKDQGVGIAAKNIDKIFHKFSRVENPLSDAAEGSGLGLYWAKKIIDLHQGTITVKSSLGKGTTFTIKLPL